MMALRIAHLRRAFGLSLDQAALIATLVYGEGRE